MRIQETVEVDGSVPNCTIPSSLHPVPVTNCIMTLPVAPPYLSSKQYIFPICPHGILLLSRVAIYGGVWEELFPGIEIRTLAASPLFFIPPIREITILLGGVDASRSYAERVLKDGYSLSLYPGGSKEIFTTDPYSPATRLVLQSRRGFIKLALKYGTPLVPVYVFGEKYAYDKLQTTSGISRWLLKTFRIPFLVFWGR